MLISARLRQFTLYGGLAVAFAALVYAIGAASGGRTTTTAVAVREDSPAADTPHARFERCKRNLGQIATALERYSADHRGKYPPTLGTLVPTYLPAMPTCPAAHSDTYTASYAVSDHPPTFSIGCHGDNHPTR